MKRKYFFLHLPKTAGTTLVTILGRQVFNQKFLRLNPKRTTHPKEFLSGIADVMGSIPKKQLSKVEVIGGHFAYGHHNVLPDFENYFTVLRDPVERVISEYYYMKLQGFFHKKDIVEFDLTIDDYLNHPNTYYLNNLQTRLISGIPYESGDEVTEAIYKKAVENLKQFVAVGITERLLETLALFTIKLQWKRKPIYISANVNEKKPYGKLEDVSLQKIREREKYDIMLYEKATEIFQRHLKQCNTTDKFDSLIKKIENPSFGYTRYLSIVNTVSRIRKKIRNRLNFD